MTFMNSNVINLIN